MLTKTKLIGAGIGVAAITAAGVGVAAAAPSSPGTTSPSPSAGSASAAPQAGHQAGHQGKAGKNGKRHSLLQRAEHAELTLGGAKKQRTIDLQRGTVTAVNGTTVTVKSLDGFTASYTADAKTAVRKDKKKAALSDVKVNDRVRVTALKSGSTLTLKHLGDAGPKK